METMKKTIVILLAGLLLTITAYAQSNAGAQSYPAVQESYGSGIFYSPAYNYKTYVLSGGSTAGGSYTITMAKPWIVLPDGRQVGVFSTSASITIGQGSNQETVTPSSVSSGCGSFNTNAGFGGRASNPCTITATFSNAHGIGELVQSGTSGIAEATYDAGQFGGGLVYWVTDGGIVALGTGATTTTVCTACIPVNGLVLGVVARVTTTITGTCSGWELGDGTTATRFTANNGTLTAGTVSAANLQTTSGVASTTTGMLNITSAKNIVNTCATGNPSAGALHVRAFGLLLATPNQ